MEKKCFLFPKLSYISLPFGLKKKKKKKSNLIYQKTAEQVSALGERLPYIRNEDPNFKNSIVDIVNNRSD